METGLVRRHLVQIIALAVAVGVVVALGVMALRPGSTSRRGDVPPITARTAATPDPRVDEVKAAARRFVVALWDSAKTGDPAAVRALAEAGTQAEGNSLVAATISKTDRHNFAASRVDFDETSWQVSVLEEHAAVDVSYRLYGHDAEWPSLRPRETDRETPAYPAHFQMERVGQTWLITQFN
jgi:hypothetical protein